MFGSEILEIAIGLVFVYFALSLVCSVLNETFFTILSTKAKILSKWIRNFFTDKALYDQVMKHPLVRGLYGSKEKDLTYIPSRIFALTVFDTFNDAGKEAEEMSVDSKAVQKEVKITFDRLEAGLKKHENDNFRKVMAAIIGAAKAETKSADEALKNARLAVEKWYDDSMERLTALYKRYTRRLIFGFALVICCVINADTIMIADTLSRDSVLRESIVAVASETAKETLPEDAEEQKELLRKILEKLEVPTDTTADTTAVAEATGINWLQERYDAQMNKLIIPLGWKSGPEYADDPRQAPTGWGWLYKILGILLTTVAISLGAPFWFDLLNKLVDLRFTGKKVQPETEKKDK